MNEIKSGEEILKEFFENIDTISNVNKKLAKKLMDLYNDGKFTDTNIKNMLDNLIKEEVEYEAEKD